MFDMEPRTKSVFGFDKSEAVGQAHVEVHAKAFPGLMDSVIQMLGPDIEFIEEILTQGTNTVSNRPQQLFLLSFMPLTLFLLFHLTCSSYSVGKRHKAMNVNPAFFPFMGKALIGTVEEYLRRKLNDAERAAWEEVYDEISKVIIKTIIS